MARLRVAVNRRVSFSLILAAIAFVALMSAVIADAGEKLVVAHTSGDSGYRTSILALGGTTDTVMRTSDVLISGTDLAIPANGAAIKRNAEGSQEFALIDAPTAASAVSVVTYRSPLLTTSFVVPPFGAFSAATPSKAGPIVSDDQDGTWVTVFPKESTPVYLRILDGSGVQVGAEVFEATPPATQYQLRTKVPVGFVIATITTGPQWGCFPRDCSSYAPLYGFVTSSSPMSGNLRAMPFGH